MLPIIVVVVLFCMPFVLVVQFHPVNNLYLANLAIKINEEDNNPYLFIPVLILSFILINCK